MNQPSASDPRPPRPAVAPDDPDRPRPLSGLGPAALLLPVLSALALGLFVTERRSQRTDAEPPAMRVEEGELEAWVGALELADGARLEVRLSPLQTDPRRQRFDRDALSARLGLGDGEPWRLEVGLSADGSAPVQLAAPRVSDRDGDASAPLATDADGPLATLLTFADGVELQPGESVQVVLWGRAPHGSVRTVGLAADGRPLECPLVPSALHEAELPASVARRR